MFLSVTVVITWYLVFNPVLTLHDVRLLQTGHSLLRTYHERDDCWMEENKT
jgi:hypothetical protein